MAEAAPQLAWREFAPPHRPEPAARRAGRRAGGDLPGRPRGRAGRRPGARRPAPCWRAVGWPEADHREPPLPRRRQPRGRRHRWTASTPPPWSTSGPARRRPPSSARRLAAASNPRPPPSGARSPPTAIPPWWRWPKRPRARGVAFIQGDRRVSVGLGAGSLDLVPRRAARRPRRSTGRRSTTSR